jgi:hypothetical protein
VRTYEIVKKTLQNVAINKLKNSFIFGKTNVEIFIKQHSFGIIKHALDNPIYMYMFRLQKG